MADTDALVLLLDRYLSWGRLPAGVGLEEKVTEFVAAEGLMAVHEAREAIRWFQGEVTRTRGAANPLSLDSLDVVEFVMEIEDGHGLKLSAEDLQDLPELLQRVGSLLDDWIDWTDDEGGSSVREPRPNRPSSPRSDGAVVECPEQSSQAGS